MTTATDNPAQWPEVAAPDGAGHVETLHLDRGYDSKGVEATCTDLGLGRRRLCPPAACRNEGGHEAGSEGPTARDALASRTDQRVAIELRQLRRNTDRNIAPRLA